MLCEKVAYCIYQCQPAQSTQAYMGLHILLSLTLYQKDKILGLPEVEAFADDNLNITQNIKVVFHRIENIVGKEENAGYQHFLLFPQCFQKAFSSSTSKVAIVW